ncbi:MAG: hypothetical protein ACREBN_08935 [Burkholderiaceae bacterium]
MTNEESLQPLRPFLRNWVWEHGHIGTRYLDCATGEIRFDDGKKARFAAQTHFFVSLTREVGDKAHTAAPSFHEARLARFVRAAQLGKLDEAGSPVEVQHAVQDCVDLALVCAYQSEAQQALARYAQEAMFDDEIRDATASDIRRLYLPLREQLALYDFTVFHSLPAPLMISESPFIDWRVRARPVQPFVSLPLGPYCLLVGTPSGKTSRAGPVLWKTASVMGPFKEHNRYLVESARQWLVATSDDQLLAVQSRFAPPEPEKPDTAPV